jgi:transposase-like protein
MIEFQDSKGELYFCHEDNEKKRCPNCHSLKSKKKGFHYSNTQTIRGQQRRKTQRYYCNDCGTNFTSQGFNVRKGICDNLKRKAVYDYVATKNSLEEVSHRYGVSKSSILNWLLPISERYPSLSVIDRYSQWSGVIQIDGKVIKLQGKKKVLLVATDAKETKPFHYEIVEQENSAESTRFLKKVRSVYPVDIKGVISDFGRGRCFLKPVAEIFPSIPHQTCLVHYQRYVWLFIPRTRRSKYFWRNKVLKGIIKKILKAEGRKESLYWLEKLTHFKPFFRASYHKRFVRSVIKHYDYLTRHFDYGFLGTNTNISENINRQIERKIKNMDGFKSETNLKAFLRIWFACFRIRKSL